MDIVKCFYFVAIGTTDINLSLRQRTARSMRNERRMHCTVRVVAVVPEGSSQVEMKSYLCKMYSF